VVPQIIARELPTPRAHQRCTQDDPLVCVAVAFLRSDVGDSYASQRNLAEQTEPFEKPAANLCAGSIRHPFVPTEQVYANPSRRNVVGTR
jgi:hypothetical protein